jgi:hypothetical protein
MNVGSPTIIGKELKIKRGLASSSSYFGRNNLEQ